MTYLLDYLPARVRFTILNLIVVIFSTFTVVGCNGKSSSNHGPQSRFVMVLLDETSSFRLDNSSGNPARLFWQEVIGWAKKVVKELQPGDGFGVIGIDDHGFDQDDVRINLTKLDLGTLKATQEKHALRRKLTDLNRRMGKPPYTDIFGTLQHAAYFLEKEKSFQPIILIFSDMIQTPRMPSKQEIAKLKFPSGTKIFCFYVNATGRDSWDRIVAAWSEIFRLAGVANAADTEAVFNQVRETQVQMRELFAMLRQ